MLAGGRSATAQTLDSSASCSRRELASFSSTRGDRGGTVFVFFSSSGNAGPRSSRGARACATCWVLPRNSASRFGGAKSRRARRCLCHHGPRTFGRAPCHADPVGLSGPFHVVRRRFLGRFFAPMPLLISQILVGTVSQPSLTATPRSSASDVLEGQKWAIKIVTCYPRVTELAWCLGDHSASVERPSPAGG